MAACSTTGPTAETDHRSLAPSRAPTQAPTEAPTATPSAAPTATAAPRWDVLPVAANDAAGLAQQLVTVEAAIRDPNVSGEQLAWTGHLQQLAYSRLQDYPEWKDSVLAALPPATRTAVSGSLEAGKQPRLLSGPLPQTRPHREIGEAAANRALLR